MNKFDGEPDYSHPNTSGITPEQKHMLRIAQSDADALVVMYGSKSAALEKLRTMPLAEPPKIKKLDEFGEIYETQSGTEIDRIKALRQMTIEALT